MTTDLTLMSKIFSLPPHLKEDVLKYVHFLLFQEKKQTERVFKKTPKAGFSKIEFKMSLDFDAPLEDFKDYME
jgi:hypothetical protein